MAKKMKFKPVATVMWIVGVLVALAVGFGMTSGTLSIPLIHTVITMTAGWIIVVLTIIGAVMALMKQIM